MAATNKKCLSPDEVGVILNVSKRTVYRLIEKCDLQALKVRGCLRITFDEVERYIKRQVAIFQNDNGVKYHDRA